MGALAFRSAYSLGICRELGIAIFTHAKHREIILSFDDPKLAFRHALIFPQGGPDCYPVEIQPAPLPLLEIVGVIVRRGKALDFSGCKSRPGTGSLHPVAIEAAAEATKLSELSMERVV